MNEKEDNYSESESTRNVEQDSEEFEKTKRKEIKKQQSEKQKDIDYTQIFKVRDLIINGYTYQEISKKIGCNLIYINNLINIAKKNGMWLSEENIENYSQLRQKQNDEKRKRIEEQKIKEQERERQDIEKKRHEREIKRQEQELRKQKQRKQEHEKLTLIENERKRQKEIRDKKEKKEMKKNIKDCQMKLLKKID